MVKLFETKYAKPVFNALRKQVVEFADTLEINGVQAAYNHISFTLFNENLEKVVTDLYVEAGLTRAKLIRQELRQEEQKRFGLNQEFIDAIIDYLNRYILDKTVRPVSQTTREWVLKTISEGTQAGLGPREIAAILRRGGLADANGVTYLQYQAMRVVRTETVRATNTGALMAAKSSPFVVTKQWIAAHDFRVRHSHKLIDGMMIEIDDEFIVQRWKGRRYLGTDRMLFPGDPKASAENTINCRCTFVAIPKRDERGRLIRNNINAVLN